MMVRFSIFFSLRADGLATTTVFTATCSVVVTTALLPQAARSTGMTAKMRQVFTMKRFPLKSLVGGT